MTHPTSSTSGAPSMASLLARVQPDAPEPHADSKAAPTTAAAAAEAKPVTVGLNGKPSTVTASRASSEGTPPADGTTKGVPVKRLLVWAVPLVFLAVGAALMHQSQTAGMIFLLLAFVALIIVLIAKWLGKRRAARAAANGGPHAKSPGRGPGADRGGGPGGGKGGLRGAFAALWPFGKRNRVGGPGGGPGRGPGGPGGPGAKPPAGGKAPAGGSGAPGGKGGGMFTKLNPFSRNKSGTPGGKPAAAGSPGGKPAAAGSPSGKPSAAGAKPPAGGKTGSPSAGAPAAPKGLGGKLRGLLGGKPAGAPSKPAGASGGPGGRAPAGGRTPGSARGPSGPGSGGPGAAGAAGGTRAGLLRGVFGGKTPGPAVPPGSPSGGPATPGGESGRRRWWRRSRNEAAENPRDWRNSSQRYEEWSPPFRRGSKVPRDLASEETPFRDPADPANSSGRWRTKHGSEYRGGGQREPFATPGGGGAHRNPDGSYNAEPVDDNHAPRAARYVHAERMDQSPANSSGSRPLAPAPAGLGPAGSSNTDTSGGNTMSHTDQQTGARSASVLEQGAATARAGAARKDDIAASHRRQAAAVSGIPEMTEDAAMLRAQAARASADAGARRGIGAAFSQAAAAHAADSHSG